MEIPDTSEENSLTEEFEETKHLPPMVISVTENQEVEMVSMSAYNFGAFLFKLIQHKDSEWKIAKAGQQFTGRMLEQCEKQEAHQLWNTKKN